MSNIKNIGTLLGVFKKVPKIGHVYIHLYILLYYILTIIANSTYILNILRSRFKVLASSNLLKIDI